MMSFSESALVAIGESNSPDGEGERIRDRRELFDFRPHSKRASTSKTLIEASNSEAATETREQGPSAPSQSARTRPSGTESSQDKDEMVHEKNLKSTSAKRSKLFKTVGNRKDSGKKGLRNTEEDELIDSEIGSTIQLTQDPAVDVPLQPRPRTAKSVPSSKDPPLMTKAKGDIQLARNPPILEPVNKSKISPPSASKTLSPGYPRTKGLEKDVIKNVHPVQEQPKRDAMIHSAKESKRKSSELTQPDTNDPERGKDPHESTPKKRTRVKWSDEEDQIMIEMIEDNGSLTPRQLLPRIAERLGQDKHVPQVKTRLRNLVKSGRLSKLPNSTEPIKQMDDTPAEEMMELENLSSLPTDAELLPSAADGDSEPEGPVLEFNPLSLPEAPIPSKDEDSASQEERNPVRRKKDKRERRDQVERRGSRKRRVDA